MTASTRDDGTRWIWAILGGLAAVVWIMAATFAIIGTTCAARSEEAARSWPATEGVVVRSSVGEEEYRNAKDGQTYTRRTIDLAYTYEVNGVRHEGHNYDVEGSLDSSALDRIAAENPVGARVRVFYDPSDPKSAALSTEVSTVSRVFQGLGVLLAAIGSVFAFFAMRSFFRRSRRAR